MPDSSVVLPVDGAGKALRTFLPSGRTTHDQYVIPVDPRVVTFRGRGNTFRIPGRAGTTGARLATIHNATGSTVLVNVNRISVDAVATVVKAVTVLPPIIRISRITALPTGGTAITKAPIDTALTTSASVTLLGDASADSTLSGTQLAATAVAGQVLTQEYMPRLITAAGYEVGDRISFFEGEPDVTLRALEGLVIHLDYTLVTQNVATDMWIVTIDWEEFTV